MDSSEQGLTSLLTPSNNSVVQANITTIGDEAKVPALPTSRSAQTLPEQTPVQMLSRLRELASFTWTTASSGVLFFDDLESLLRTNAEHAPLLKQYRLYRSDFKIFLRINSNQFYSGALMVTLWPTASAQFGNFLNQRAMLRPVTMSASTQQSCEINVSYPFREEWIYSAIPDAGVDQRLNLCVEVLAPLIASSDTLTDTLTVQLFAAYVNPVLQLNADASEAPVAQSKVEITKKIEGGTLKSTVSATPATDANRRQGGMDKSFKEIAPTLSSIPILGTVVGSLFDILKIGVNTVTGLVPVATALAPLAPLLLDKPEVVGDIQRFYGNPCQDQFSSDVAALTTPFTYSKNNYGAMLSGFGVALGHWTLAQYASVPGIAARGTLNTLTTSGDVPLYGAPTALGRLQSSFRYWKGSIKVTFQAFASAFTSVRMAVYLRPFGETSLNFDDHIVKIIDVKGDTVSSFTIPFVHHRAWYTAAPNFSLHYRLISPIIGNDVALDPSISFVWWTAAGPDAQFAIECPPTTWVMPTTSPLPDPALSAPALPVPPSKAKRLTRAAPSVKKSFEAEAQSSIQHHFVEEKFPPIVDGCSYTVDNGYAITDVPVTFNDLLKRYRSYDGALATGFDIDNLYFGTDPALSNHAQWLNNFGAIRGGYMIKSRFRDDNETDLIGHVVAVTSVVNNVALPTGSHSICGDDGYHCVSFPWIANFPFWFRTGLTGHSHQKLSQLPYGTGALAFRDDLVLGLPVLPLTGE